MILLQISYESYIAIIATLMSVCAVFVTVTPMVYSKWIKELENKLRKELSNEINEIERKVADLNCKIDEISKCLSHDIQRAKKQSEEVNRAIEEAKK